MSKRYVVIVQKKSCNTFQWKVLQEQVRQLEEVLVYEVEQEIQQLERKMSVHWVCSGL